MRLDRTYEAMGIAEYWIVDYLGLGGRRDIGNPKQPTVTICCWVNGVCESPEFPGLRLTTGQIFAAGSEAYPI